MIFVVLISLCVIFCTNLVKIIKEEQSTSTHTVWLTASFTLIVCIIALISMIE